MRVHACVYCVRPPCVYILAACGNQVCEFGEECTTPQCSGPGQCRRDCPVLPASTRCPIANEKVRLGLGYHGSAVTPSVHTLVIPVVTMGLEDGFTSFADMNTLRTPSASGWPSVYVALNQCLSWRLETTSTKLMSLCPSRPLPSILTCRSAQVVASARVLTRTACASAGTLASRASPVHLGTRR